MKYLQIRGNVEVPPQTASRMGDMYHYLRSQGFSFSDFGIIYRREPGFPKVFFAFKAKEKVTEEIKEKIKANSMTYSINIK